jgi:2-methylisocitrate lyase-like PEP mutase family enzyme
MDSISAVGRARAYAEAGADCIYPIGPGDEETARILRARIELPINILVTPSTAPLKVLETIGVNRVSFGPFVFRSCLRKFIEITETLMNQGDYSCFSDMLSKAETSEYLTDGDE